LETWKSLNLRENKHKFWLLHVSVFDYPQELVKGLAKTTLLLKHSVKLRRCILCGDVAACREMVCVLFVVQTRAITMCIFM